MPIKYAVVNEGTKLIAEYPAGEFPKLAQTLQKILATVFPREYRRQAMEDEDATYNYLANGEGLIVGCVATRDTKSRIIFDFLEAVEALIHGPAADLRNAKKLLQTKMEFFSNPANDKFSAVQESIDRAKASLAERIDKLCARGDEIDKLQQVAAEFDSKAQALKIAMSAERAKEDKLDMHAPQ